jgi:hypothetical protein
LGDTCLDRDVLPPPARDLDRDLSQSIRSNREGGAQIDVPGNGLR